MWFVSDSPFLKDRLDATIRVLRNAILKLLSLTSRSRALRSLFGVQRWELLKMQLRIMAGVALAVCPDSDPTGLAVAIGLFIGLERERSGKNGVRTFALTALLGCLGGFIGDVLHDRIGLCGDGGSWRTTGKWCCRKR